MPDTAQPDMSELVKVGIRHNIRILDVGSLRNGHNTKSFTPSMSFFNELANFIDFDRNFRNEDDIRTPSKSGLQSDPARMPAHNLNHHHTVMRFRRCMKAVDALHGNIKRGIVSESVICHGV